MTSRGQTTSSGFFVQKVQATELQDGILLLFSNPVDSFLSNNTFTMCNRGFTLCKNSWCIVLPFIFRECCADCSNRFRSHSAKGISISIVLSRFVLYFKVKIHQLSQPSVSSTVQLSRGKYISQGVVVSRDGKLCSL